MWDIHPTLNRCVYRKDVMIRGGVKYMCGKHFCTSSAYRLVPCKPHFHHVNWSATGLDFPVGNHG